MLSYSIRSIYPPTLRDLAPNLYYPESWLSQVV